MFLALDTTNTDTNSETADTNTANTEIEEIIPEDFNNENSFQPTNTNSDINWFEEPIGKYNLLIFLLYKKITYNLQIIFYFKYQMMKEILQLLQ